MCNHIEDGSGGFCQVFVGSQRNGFDQLVNDSCRFMRVGDDDGLPGIEIGHERLERRVAEILSIAVGRQLDTVSAQFFQGIPRFFQRAVHVWKRQSCTEEKTAGIKRFQRSGLFVELAAHCSRFCAVAEIRLRCRHGEDGRLYFRPVHKLQMVFDIPRGEGEPLVHFHSVGFDRLQVGIRNHVAVHICLCTAHDANTHECQDTEEFLHLIPSYVPSRRGYRCRRHRPGFPGG